jgi:GTPase
MLMRFACRFHLAHNPALTANYKTQPVLPRAHHWGVQMFGLSRQAGLLHLRPMPGLIAIVGRPNVGKSALFNRIVGRRVAIVHDRPGVTRDRISVEAEWRGQVFTLVDTGGIGLLRREKPADAIVAAAMEQAELAMQAADVIILVVNVRDGVAPLDAEVADRLRRSQKPILVAVNKVDHEGLETGVAEFTELGFDKLLPVSAIHGLGIGPLMDAALAWLPAGLDGGSTAQAALELGSPELPDAPQETVALQEPLKLAIVGRPNVGKSSLVNALTRSERVIVSPIPGTTRDAVDVPFEVETDGVRQRYVLIDTAGVRHERRMADSIEFFSVKRAEDSIDRCDIAILVLDAQAGVTAHDKQVAGKILDARKACIIVINKWDLVEQEVAKAREAELGRRQDRERRFGCPQPLTTLAEFGAWVQEQLFFLDYAPVIFASAKSGFHLERLLEGIRYVAAQLRQKVSTALLNRALQEAIEERQPVSAAGQRLKFFYATEVRRAPPTFLLFVNRPDLLSDSYARYLVNRLRRAFGFEGCPVILVPKARPKTIEPKRKTVAAPARQQGGGAFGKMRQHRRRHTGRSQPARRPAAR